MSRGVLGLIAGAVVGGVMGGATYKAGKGVAHVLSAPARRWREETTRGSGVPDLSAFCHDDVLGRLSTRKAQPRRTTGDRRRGRRDGAQGRQIRRVGLGHAGHAPRKGKSRRKTM